MPKPPSPNNEEDLIIDTHSEMNDNDTNRKENDEDHKFIDFEKYTNNDKIINQYQKKLRSSKGRKSSVFLVDVKSSITKENDLFDGKKLKNFDNDNSYKKSAIFLKNIKVLSDQKTNKKGKIRSYSIKKNEYKYADLDSNLMHKVELNKNSKKNRINFAEETEKIKEE